MSFGFTKDQSEKALIQAQGNINTATDRLFNEQDP